MSVKVPPHQGRARGLYDEQLQRQQQEKLLIRGASLAGSGGPALRFAAPAALAPSAEDAKTGAR